MHMPHIDAKLDEVLSVLNDLEIQLPVIHTQAAHVCRLYDSSHENVFSHPILPALYPLPLR
jgi:hypothetical protein